MRQQGGSAGLRVVLALIACIAFFIELVYRDAITAYMALLTTDEYSYLTVAVAILLAIVVIESENIVGVRRVHLGRLLASAVMLSFSYIILMFSLISNEYIVELKMMSLILLVWGLVAVSLGSRDMRAIGVIVLLSVLVIPIPRPFIDEIAVELSTIVANSVSWITGAKIARGYGSRLMLLVEDKDGFPVRYEIVSVCSGVVSLLSIVSLSILPIYIALKSSASIRRRVLGALLSIAMGIMIVFAGNILRIALVVWITRSYGHEAAMGFFHTTPSIIYSSLATLAVVATSIRLVGARVFSAANRMGGGDPTRPSDVHVGSTPSPLLALMLMVLVFASLYSLSLAAFQQPYGAGEPLGFQDLYMNVSSIIFNGTGATVVYEVDNPALAESLGSSLVKEIGVRYGGRFYTGYIEIAESPGRFHSWSVCLTYQGYVIEDTWSVNVNNTVVDLMLLRDREGGSLVLAYTTYAVPVYFGDRKTTVYIRLSLFKHGRDYSDLIGLFGRIHVGSMEMTVFERQLETWVAIVKTASIGILVYFIATIAFYLRMRRRGRG